MISQSFSTSHNAGIVTLVGGPFDGTQGLYDHNFFDVIAVCDWQKKGTHNYVPEAKGRSWQYLYDRSY
jgi:hypothetical protein